MQDNLPSPLLSGLLDLAIEAGKAVMAVYLRETQTRWKDDATPVTAADLTAENIILAGLAKLAPATPAISEESAAAGFVPPLGHRFFLVDPLDGTKEFLAGNGEFTVNIALVENFTPLCGIVFAPALPRLFWAESGKGAFEAAVSSAGKLVNPCDRRLNASPLPSSGLRVVASRSHRDRLTEEWLKSRDIGKLVCAGSSLKFCLIAAGEADIYPRFGRTMEWDTAAGHAILSAAGGKVLTDGDKPLVYGKVAERFANPSFIASGP
jgi:3'(2'), 5'-bisphosphate nucleotidase